MARGRSDSFRRNFLGIHLFNPPHVIVGTEVIPHPDTDPAVTSRASCAMLTKRLGRKVIVTSDMPAFVGNRVGFKVLNETAQLAAEHGVAFIDYLIGPHTGRAMAPLATVDLVGWDVHKAIVDNVYANCEDEAHACVRDAGVHERGLAEGMPRRQDAGAWRVLSSRGQGQSPCSTRRRAVTTSWRSRRRSSSSNR